MRRYTRIVLVLLAFVIPVVLLSTVLGTTTPKAQALPKPHKPIQSQPRSINPLDITLSYTYQMDVYSMKLQAFEEESSIPTSQAIPVPQAPSTPVTTVTDTAPLLTSSDLLLQAPEYVQTAFSCIRMIESHNDSTVVNSSSGDGGLYQFNSGTWRAVIQRAGGAGFPAYAQDGTVIQQDDVAFWAWQQDGFSPWNGDNHCWE